MINSRLTSEEIYLFGEGTWFRTYDQLGAHPASLNQTEGFCFAVWCPGARSVRVTGSFNDWRTDGCLMTVTRTGGIWETFIPGARVGDLYKYLIETESGELIYKADPFAFATECPPETASRLTDLSGFVWQDQSWLTQRLDSGFVNQPLNIYEVHPGSWKLNSDGSFYSWLQLAAELVPYAAGMGYTHIELLPVMEHPYGGSWGYQITGYYAPTSRYGSPADFMFFVDACHQSGLGVILDWVPGHFCRDAHGLGRFNGDKLFEKSDHIQWGTYKFDLGRGEVRSFLISNALFWMEQYHIDGLRVDGVTSMLYQNFGIEDNALKSFNDDGTEEDRAAVDFIRRTNQAVSANFPDVMMIAEESTAWPLVTYPPESGGLGFHFKWDMGWMNDTLRYMQTDFPYRPGNHYLLTFSMMYAFNENFILPLSHDEVVHGKCSLIGRMPGDYWRQFAGLRLLTMYQICHPGAKLNFMGNEIGQFIEWRYYEGIEWFLTDFEPHRAHQEFVRTLNQLFKAQSAFWELDRSWQGFKWLDADNSSQSVLSFIRRGRQPDDELIIILNCITENIGEYRIGVPSPGCYQEIFNSDATAFGGSGKINEGFLMAEAIPWQGMAQSVILHLPPIGGLILKKSTEPVQGDK